MLITGSDSSQPTTLSMFSSFTATGTRFGKLREGHVGTGPPATRERRGIA